MAETRDSIGDVWGARTPHPPGTPWPVRVDERTVESPDRWVQSACVLCSNGCALDIGVKDGRIVGVRGRGVDRVNRGRLGPKGLHGWEANHSPDRLKTPLIRSRGRLKAASWDEAMGLVVERSRAVIESASSSAIGIYNTGQLFIEDYYTLAVIGKAGLGTPHMDGNTRLCTATAARAMIESCGSDGHPGSYEDLDWADAILLAGHNMASQQTVLWARILDRLDGPEPPKLVVIDPRATETAKKATVHIANRVGTNVAVMNGLIHLVIQAGRIDEAFVREHTVGFETLRAAVSAYPPERVEQIARVPAATLRAAAEILGSAKRLTSTILQGFYQSNQASAAAVQVNNLNLICGMIGRPGCGVLQMNGQPTAENTRECGCDGEMPAFRNWNNPAHIDELAALWNVDRDRIPHWATPTHAMQIFRYAEEGSIRLLWVIATNPAVSMPDLPRIRDILSKKGLFLVVQDAFRTETTEYADVVLPAALWGEKTGCFTNVDRTVHISHKAIDPPGEARADLDIFLDYARRMDFRDKDGAPLLKWHDPEGAFDAWRECSRGKVCDYSGMSYAKLSEGSGIQWPCNDRYPDGKERLYDDFRFNTTPDRCSDYGHDLDTGAAIQEESFRAHDPSGSAILKSVDYIPPFEEPDDDYPFWYTTGRVVYHFHTRTKTGRSAALNAAAPDAFVQISEADANRLGIAEGDLVEVESRRGSIRVPAKIGDILDGHLFVPFHYGYWDEGGRPRAANELTLPDWDPVSKQPVFKYTAAKARKATLMDPAEEAAGSVIRTVKRAGSAMRAAVSSAPAGDRHVASYVGMIVQGERSLAQSLESVAERWTSQPDTTPILRLMASWSRAHQERLKPIEERYSSGNGREPTRLASSLFRGSRSGGVGLLRDLHDLWLMAHEVHVTWEILSQAARALRDEEFIAICEEGRNDNNRQIAWIRTRIDASAPQALVVPS